jgi:signal transduction histidine kinase
MRARVRRILSAWLEATTWRDLGYVLLGLPVSVVAFVLAIGIAVTATLILILVALPPLILFLVLGRGVAQLERRRAALVLEEPIPAVYRQPESTRFSDRARSAVGDPQTYKDIAWLAVVSVLGFIGGIAVVVLVQLVVGMITYPAWNGLLPDQGDVSIPAALYPPVGLVLAILTPWIVRGIASLQTTAAWALLGPTEAQVRRASGGRVDGAKPRRVLSEALESTAKLSVHASLVVIVSLVVAIIWAATGRGYFWPAWVWLGVGKTLALHAAVLYAKQHTSGRQRRLAVQAAISVVLGVALIAIWLLSGGTYFWPIWPLTALGVALALHALWLRMRPARAQELEERVDVLTRTRRGALDVQADELRRIERDLHDGAQARLVSLSMQLGRAEEGLADQPAAAELVRQARDEASAAIAELRDLARGIAPPVLTDRGLGAAIEALGRRAAIPVAVDVAIDRRPPAVGEGAAYFVVAEALTNVAKHAPEAEALVSVKLGGELLTVEVADNGGGGADQDVGGLGGLRQRVEALDGSLWVASPPGEGTTIHAELPCAW